MFYIIIYSNSLMFVYIPQTHAGPPRCDQRWPARYGAAPIYRGAKRQNLIRPGARCQAGLWSNQRQGKRVKERFGRITIIVRWKRAATNELLIGPNRSACVCVYMFICRTNTVLNFARSVCGRPKCVRSGFAHRRRSDFLISLFFLFSSSLFECRNGCNSITVVASYTKSPTD